MQKYKLPQAAAIPEFSKKGFSFKLSKYTEARDGVLNELKENMINSYFEEKWKTLDPFYEEYNVIGQIIDSPYIGEKWTTSYEIINHFKLIPETSEHEFLHFDSEALPGDFLLAAVHYANSRCLLGDKYKWVANSIREEDNKMDHYQLYEKNSQNWLLDLTIDGDLSKIDTLKTLQGKISNNADLYSACFSKTKKYIGRFLCGFISLKMAGNMVIAIKEPENEVTACLIALVSASFDESYLVISAASYCKETTFLVAKKYRGVPPNIIEDLYKLLQEEEISFLRPKSLGTFMSEYQNILKKIIKKETSFIENNIYLCKDEKHVYLNKNREDEKDMSFTELQEYIEKWYILNPISPIF